MKRNSRRTQSRRRRSRRQRKRVPFWLVPLIGVAFFGGYKQLKVAFAEPQVIFVLGGEERRESFAAQFAQDHPDLPIWVSSGSPQAYAERLFANRGVNRDRVHLDYQAQDTVTNFTTAVDRLKAKGVDSVYLVTSDDHMPRARVVGEIVFGSRGITIKAIAVPTEREPEPLQKCVRDGVR
ncbi:MAG: YdcF family protein, partial [Cyanobacteriota bacterium]|nr:YdcF family protein [Cyanobacteriota bacterium]